jgi:trk system potassium uptake protein
MLIDFFNEGNVKKGLRYTDLMMLYVSFIGALLVLLDIGYNSDPDIASVLNSVITSIFYGFAIILLLKVVLRFFFKSKNKGFQYTELFLCLYFWFVIIERSISPVSIDALFRQGEWLFVGIFAVLLVEISKNSLFFDRFYFNPTLLFVMSFLFLVLLGTALLLLPKVTIDRPLSFVDALFMATSAVCITGLSVVDISSQFSVFGQVILMVLIQLGGLGIMTFTGFFGYFFSGSFSYKNQLMYTELLSEKKLGSVINTLLKIITITFFFEAIGAALIYFYTLDIAGDLGVNHVFFSVFHAISSFCNAGFSIVPDGLYHGALRFNYPFIIILSLLFIFGGLGFGIMFNTFTLVKRWIINIFKRVAYGKPFTYKAWVISFNSRLVAYTTVILLVFGTISCFLLEYQQTLVEHETFFGKLVTAFFMGSSPRTAGFNTVNMGNLTTPTVMVIMLLMWIGASPASTGGGIKTTTFAVIVLNMVSLVKGRDRVEVFKREISTDSLRRSSAVVLLSLFGLGLSVFFLCMTDGDKDVKSLAFECFSAYGTVGLSLGITPEISSGGKVVLTASMFVGRVGALTLLVALIKESGFRKHRYPQEKVLF